VINKSELGKEAEAAAAFAKSQGKPKKKESQENSDGPYPGEEKGLGVWFLVVVFGGCWLGGVVVWGGCGCFWCFAKYRRKYSRPSRLNIRRGQAAETKVTSQNNGRLKTKKI